MFKIHEEKKLKNLFIFDLKKKLKKKIMKSFLLVFILDSFISYELLVRMTSIFQGSPRRKVFWAVSVFLLALHLGVYFSQKPQNFYQKMDIPRYHNSSDLKKAYRESKIKYHPDKIKAANMHVPENLFIEFQQIFEILNDPKNKNLYDLFGSKEPKEANELLTFGISETGMLYVVFLIFGIILTYDENVQKSRKWFVLLIFITAGLEVFYYLGKETGDWDYLDYIFSKGAIFERIQIGRIIVGLLGNIVRAAYRLFWRVSMDIIMEKNEEIIYYQNKIKNLIAKNGANTPEVTILAEKINQISREVYGNIQKELDSREKNGNAGGVIKKILKWGVILLMIGGVYNQFTNEA